MSCQEIVELVTEYLDGVLDPETTARVEHHLELCPGCLNYVEQMRTTARILDASQPEPLDPVFRERLLDAFRKWR
ncbi:anti-sigma factor [Nocardiaceae bacterium YC2-7]|uniref:Anti-sigma factor n=1 Tax=Antrihabitans stalactiti TaxID=2584121 RepID=A0A848K8N7_9NOCA|nr:anti-sigma factor [Antrihabitans stalactiti]